MYDFKIHEADESGAYFDYDIGFVKVESFAQRVLLTLNTWQGEFAYDTDKGIDFQTILKNDFPIRSLEAFFLFNLKRQLPDFDTIDGFKAEHDIASSTVTISFTAYSKTGEELVINNLAL